MYQTSDGKYLTIAAIEPWFWENLCRAPGRDDLAGSQTAAADSGEVSRILSKDLRKRTRDQWFELLKDNNISVGKVYSRKPFPILKWPTGVWWWK